MARLIVNNVVANKTNNDWIGPFLKRTALQCISHMREITCQLIFPYITTGSHHRTPVIDRQISSVYALELLVGLNEITAWLRITPGPIETPYMHHYHV